MDESTPQVTIALPVWNKDETARVLCRRAIASIVNYVRTPYEIILVDNCSPCGDVLKDNEDLLERIGGGTEWPHYIVLTLPRNTGFGPAVNRALKLATGSYFCQMNTDAELLEDSVSLLIHAMQVHNLDVGMPEHFENCMVYGLGKDQQVMGGDWRFGAFYVARIRALRAVGGYDEAFEMCYWEDTDLWRRMEKAGLRIAGWRGTWVSHWGGASSHPERDRYFAENRDRYAERWGIKL
jgi:GT2 family glycosyltransferase